MAAVARMMSALALRCARQHAAYMAAAPARSSKAAAEPAAAAGGGAGRLPIHPQHQQLLQSRSRRLRLADAPAAGAGLGAATAPSHPTAASGGLQQSRPQDVAWDAQIFDSSSALVATATMHPPTLSPLDEASLGAFHEAWEKAAVRPLQASAALADTTGINIAAAIRKIAQDYDWPLEDEAAAAAAAAGTPAHAIVLAACCPLPPLPGSAAASTKAHKAAAKQALDTLLPRELRELLAQRRIALIWLDCSGAASSPNITDVRQQLAAQLFKHAGSALVDIDLVLSGVSAKNMLPFCFSKEEKLTITNPPLQALAGWTARHSLMPFYHLPSSRAAWSPQHPRPCCASTAAARCFRHALSWNCVPWRSPLQLPPRPATQQAQPTPCTCLAWCRRQRCQPACWPCLPTISALPSVWPWTAPSARRRRLSPFLTPSPAMLQRLLLSLPTPPPTCGHWRCSSRPQALARWPR